MRLRFLVVLVLLAGLAGVFAQVPARAPAPASSPGVKLKSNVTAADLTREQMEQFLKTANIVSERPAGKGITGTLRVTLSDGTHIHDAHVQQIDVYKAEYRTKDGIERDFRDSYKFNIAAYRLDSIMDLGMIPVCVYREYKGKPSAIDWWVDDVQFDEEGRRAKDANPPDLNRWVRQLNEIRDFDELIYNEDRNQGNLLIDKSWKLWAIDHSRSFRDKTNLRNPDVLRRISNKQLNAMKALNQQLLEDLLLPYVTRQDIADLLIRRDLIVRFFENEIQSKGGDAILTDLPRKTPQVTIP